MKVLETAGVVSCGGPKIAPYIVHSAVFLFFWSFEISRNINRIRNRVSLFGHFCILTFWDTIKNLRHTSMNFN